MSATPAAEAPAPGQRLTRYRHEESENYLARGVECMLLAEEGGYADRELLTEACDSFIEAIKFNRQNTEAYVGMAYLLWILGDTRQAQSYLEQGLRTNPNNADVHAMIHKISGRPARPDAQAQAAPELVDAEVIAMVKELLAYLDEDKTAAIAPTVNQHALERLQEKLNDWELRYDDVLVGIDRLEAFHQRVLLTVELGPVQDRILAYHEALRQSERMVALDDKIQENASLARQYLADLAKGDLGLYRAYLEIMLDNCDSLADELEVFEKEGFNIRTLESHYQQLADAVEDLQTRLEGGADA